MILRDNNGNVDRMIGVMQDITDRVSLELELRNQREQEHKNTTRMIFEAQESERNRIANDLHDNVNPLLAAARLYINVVESSLSGPEPHLLQSKALIHEGIDEIRKISHNLSNTLIKEHSLEEVVKNILRKMNPDNRLDISTQFKRLEKVDPDSHIKTNVARIIQEQLNNIFKYAQADHVAISLSHRDGILHLAIQDNGVGFDTAKTRTGIGLLNIRNRVESYEGQMKLISSPGKGCKLDIRLPSETRSKK